MDITARRVASTYLIGQSVLASLWWVMLVAVPASRRWFLPPSMPDEVLLSLLLPDAVLYIGAGFLAAWGLGGRAPWAWPVLVVHAGAVGYATLFALSIPILTGHGVLGAALMVASAVATSGLAWTLRPMRDVYSFGAVRGIELGPSSLFRIRLLTLAQIVVVWSVFLVLLPFVAFRVEEVLGLDGYRFPAVARGFGWALLPVTAALNLWLAVYTTGHGQGTPLPFAAMRRLVVTGPYAHVRNPMLMVSVAVGLCASVGMGSPAMVAFFLIGAVFWNEVLRPWEERDLRRRFGRAYEHYRRHVRCWVPKWRAYRRGN
jgi:protein-S-isoprenylcysteine O-methyltransferase Ste14